MTPVLSMRICIGAHHQPGCHHETYMRHGVEAFLSSERTRDALRLALAQTPVPSLSPDADAERILTYLAGVVDELDPYRAVVAHPGRIPL